MELKSKTFWEMEKESISFIRKNENYWVKKAVLAAVVNDLEKNEVSLENAFKAQDSNDPGGQVAQKNELRSKFFHNVYRLGRRLSLYAKDSGDKVLLNDVDIAETTFLKSSEKAALISCSKIIKRGYEYLERITGYDITADELKSLSDDLLILENMQPQIGLVTNDRKSAVRSIKELTNEARILLDKLDDGFEGMIDDENYLNSWFAIRKIKGRHIPKENIVPTPGEVN